MLGVDTFIYAKALVKGWIKRLSGEETSFKTLESDANGDICQKAWVEINDRALSYYVQQLKSLLSAKTQLMGVVKADAYGHGAS